MYLPSKTHPSGDDILPIALTSENIAQYEEDLVNPAAAFADQGGGTLISEKYGNICYDTRHQYVNFPGLPKTSLTPRSAAS
jgi:ribose transport system substrate-binding protein